MALVDRSSGRSSDHPKATKSRKHGNGRGLAIAEVGSAQAGDPARRSLTHGGGQVLQFGRHTITLRAQGTRFVRIRFLVAAITTLSIAAWVTPSLAAPTPLQATPLSAAPESWVGIAASPGGGGGYWVTSNQGHVESFGNAVPHGDMTGAVLNQPVVAMAASPDGKGYWLVASDGGIFNFGTAHFLGSTGSLHLNKPVVGMAPTHDGGGYWLVASDGGVFAFGDAAFEGSMGSHHLNDPIVGMAPTRDGRGYWLVASDGGIFAFGDAQFDGSLGSNPPASQIVNMTPTPDNGGYWSVDRDGTVYAFGDAAHDGSLKGWSSPTTSLAAAPSGGYWILTSDGAVHPFGEAATDGSPATSTSVTAAHPSGTTTTTVAPTALDSPASPGVSLINSTTTSSVQALSPSSGTAGGGDTIRITGSGLSGALAVYFGTNASSDFTVTSPTSITAVAPVGAGKVDIRVVMPDGTTAATSEDRFTYVATGQQPITAQGQNLEIGGVPTKFTGFNAYQLATDWGTNAGCGGMATPAQIDSFFASLRPNSLVRFWAMQGAMATNINTHQLDWAPLDNVFYEAAKYHVYLIPVISDQAGTCDGGTWQDPAWYSGGFKDVFDSPDNSDGRGLTPFSYWSYMNALVSRYADSPALGMWEPMSEAEASTCPASFEPSNCSGHQTCPDPVAAASALTYFFTTVGAQIHLLDPSHLVEGGFLGGGQCGTSWNLYSTVGASPGIDVLSVHDYYGAATLGGDQYNGMAERFAQAKALDKPIITGEVGIEAGSGQIGCPSLPTRALEMSAKMAAQFADGDSGFLVWNWDLDPLGTCNYDTGPADNSLLNAVASALSG